MRLCATLSVTFVYTNICGFGVIALNLRTSPGFPVVPPEMDILPDIPPGSPGESPFQRVLLLARRFALAVLRYRHMVMTVTTPERLSVGMVPPAWPTLRDPDPRCLHSGRHTLLNGGGSQPPNPNSVIHLSSWARVFGNWTFPETKLFTCPIILLGKEGGVAIFRGQLWLVPDRVREISVEIFLNEERIKLISDDTEIGDWPLSDVEMELRDNDIHMFVEGEELVVWSSDPGFAPSLVGEEIEDDFEPYIPWDSSARRGAHRRRKRSLLKRLLGGR